MYDFVRLNLLLNLFHKNLNMKNNISKQYLKELTYELIGIAIEIHKILGPGLLESIYHKCFVYELRNRNIPFQSELTVPILYKELELKADLRCDIFADSCLVIELKATESIAPVHEIKLLSYMKFLNAPKGLIINFNCGNLYKQGQKTYVNELFRNLPEILE